MPIMPNPFDFAGSCPADTAVVSPVSSQVEAAAELSLAELIARGFDVDGFMLDIEPFPEFLQAPIEALEVLARY